MSMRFELVPHQDFDAARRRALAPAGLDSRPSARSLHQTLAGRHPETARHLHRTAAEAELLGRRLGLGGARLERLKRAAALHDIGKIEVSERILNKPAPLDPSERRALERHTVIGHRLLLAGAGVPLRLAATIALTHHERFDGGGYPYGLAGRQIPIEGRIVAVADVLDALLSDRPYRPALPLADAVAVIERGSGSHFDPTIVAVALENLDSLITLRA